MAERNATVVGIFMMVAFAIVGPLIDTFGKLAADQIPTAQIVAARFIAQSSFLLPLAFLLGSAHRVGLAEARLHLMRAALILVATGCFFAAIKHMPIADAISIFFVEPFLLTILGGILLGEAVGPRRLLACAVGFGGALLVIKPSFSAVGPVALLPLGTALTFAFYMILTRRMAQAMHPITLQAYTALAALPLILPVLWFSEGSGISWLDPVWPDRQNWIWLLGVGVAATIAHIFISYALRLAPAATIAPLQYLEIVSAVALGFLVFGDLPDALTFLGIAIIVGSGMYVFVRERALSRREDVPPAGPAGDGAAG